MTPNDTRHSMGANHQPAVAEEALTMESILEKLGVPGKYQVLQLLILSVSVTPLSFATFNFIFTGYEPSCRCHSLNQTSVLSEQDALNDTPPANSNTLPLNSYTSNRSGLQDNRSDSQECPNVYDGEYGVHTSIATEWGLMCGEGRMLPLVQTMLMLGYVIGVIIWSPLANRYGCKAISIIAIVALISTEFGTAFAQNLQQVIVLKFLTGFFAIAMLVIQQSLASEWLVSRHRQTFGALFGVWCSMNVSLLALVAYIFRYNWRYIHLSSSALGILPLISLFWLKESPEWCFANGRYEYAERTLMKACRTNKKDVDEIRDLFRQCTKQADHRRHEEENTKAGLRKMDSLFDALNSRPFVVMTVVSCLVSLTLYIVYYAIYYLSSTLAGDRYLNFFLMACPEIPGSFIYMTMLVFLGRRQALFIFVSLSFLLISGTSVLMVWTLERLALKMIIIMSKLTIASSLNVWYSYNPEIYPTTVRTASLGLSLVFKAAGGMFSPFLVTLSNENPAIPFLVMAFLCLISLGLIPMLPETKGRQLPTTIETFTAWSKTSGKQ